MAMTTIHFASVARSFKSSFLISASISLMLIWLSFGVHSFSISSFPAHTAQWAPTFPAIHCSRWLGGQNSSSSVIYSHISFWCNQMGSVFLRINSSISIPLMVGGRLTRFCFPLMKMVMYSFCRSFFSTAVSFCLRFAMMDIRSISLLLRVYRDRVI